MTNGPGKSDRPVVPAKSPNNVGQPTTEGMEGSGLAKANLPQQNASRTPRKFNLELHPEKTRLLEFGPFANQNRQRRGEGKP